MKPSALKKFSVSHSSPLPPIDPMARKVSIPGPTSFWHFLDLLFFTIFRKPMSIDPSVKAGIYLCISAGASLVFDFIRAPPSYFSNSHNALNQYFVKLGWGWTCSFLAAFVIVSTYIYTGGSNILMRSHILRLVIGSGCWYLITGLISRVHDWTGHCYPTSLLLSNKQKPTARYACVRAGGTWLGFDISGHCFLLVMSNMWILEELKCMQYWSRLSDLIQRHDRSGSITTSPPCPPRNIHETDLSTISSAFRRLSTVARVIFCLTSFLSILWDIMFISTIIYFHTMPSKLLGAFLGVSCWFVFYRFIFPCMPSGSWGGIFPGLPGDGPLKFMPR